MTIFFNMEHYILNIWMEMCTLLILNLDFRIYSDLAQLLNYMYNIMFIFLFVAELS